MRSRLHALLVRMPLMLVPVCALAAEPDPRVPFTDPEKAWIATHPKVRVMVAPDHQPADFIDQQGRHRGIAADFLDLIEQRSGLTFERVIVPLENRLLPSPGERGVDGVSLTMRDPEGERYWRFTRPYLSFPAHLIAREDAQPGLTLDILRGAVVAVVAGYAVEEHLRTRHPHVVALRVPDTQAGLQKVAFGEAMAFVSDSPVATWWLRHAGFSNLRIAGDSGFVYRMGLSARLDAPELHAVLDKALDSIGPGERDAIIARWLPPTREPWYRSRRYWLAAALLAATIAAGLALVMTWNRTLRRTVARRTAELSRSQACYATAFATLPAAITLSRLSDDKVVEVNAEHERVFGYPRDEIVGHGARELPWPDPGTRDAIRGTIERQGFAEDIEVSVRRRDGSEVIVKGAVRRIEIAGEPHLLSMGFDVTERRRAEQRLREADEALRGLNAELERRITERTAALGRANDELQAFSHTITHDLAAPLRAIDGYAGMIEQGLGPEAPAEVGRCARGMRDAVARVHRMIEDLHDFARLRVQTLVLGPVALDRLVAEVRAQIMVEYPGRDIDWRIGPMPVVLGDKALLARVLENLLGNAAKFTARREHARIEVEAFEVPGMGEHTIVVRDNGAGFDMRQAGRLFCMFQRLHPVREFPGTGVGLASVERIVRRHGGAVRAEGESGRGASFYFTLPRAGVAPA